MRMAIDRQPTEELPDLAAAALAEGVDSPALRLLAGTSRQDVRESRDLFMQAMSELGVSPPTEAQARQVLVLFWAQQMIDGELSPYEGSRLIWREGYLELGQPANLVPFVGLASEWEDSPTYRPQYERDMIASARELLDSA
jgi:hypothetical protein